MKMLLVVLVCTLGLAGCVQDGGDWFSEGKECLAQGDREGAREAFEKAIECDDEAAGGAHYELGRLLRGERHGLSLAYWHFRMASELYRGGGVKKQEIDSALKDCGLALMKELSNVPGVSQDGGIDLRFKVELLEEHARKQSRWLEELRRENALMRRQLSEHE